MANALWVGFEFSLNRKILKHLSLHNLLSDVQYDFRQDRFTEDLRAFLTNSWSFSFRESSIHQLINSPPLSDEGS
ncbi:hypothetical protein E2C01_049943 [Portunus trituberculatus]|uniref:Uncharacterized protein n=1 Tax=Portunus trituberculatus TaxID=210409 RepID=A0A5B7GHH1_PORTR|nr:hypothetical protein [Portunus trituberculatus]